ncbi:extracellular solute-binding protein [Agromyces silvae]|uniref:extracellular solute-binding protein n=1 Tax=Agromyces silvae TaxID=3388266 RepID=UPI00280B554E|nr:extracellular solute-binding protein [Agromyces protaetiae]
MSRPTPKWVRALSVVGALALASAGLAACTSADAGTSADGIGEPGDTNISGTVTFWHAYGVDSTEVSTLRDVIIPKFNETYPDVEVQDVAVPHDELHQKLVTAVAGDVLPDLVRADLAWVPELADLGVLVPLSTEMPDFQEIADRTYPGMLATNRWQGEYYGLPLDTNTRVQLYNAEALAAAGVDAPPETVDELMEVGAALKAKDIYAFADNGAGGWNVLPWIWSAGGDITDEDVTVASGYINSEASIAGVQTFVDLYTQGFMPDTVLGDSGGLSTSDGLAQGAYATILDGPWMWPIFGSQYPDFELNAAPVPAGAGGSISVVGGEDIVLTKSSKNKAAAAEFMRFLLSEWAQIEFSKIGQISVLTDVAPQLVELNAYYEQFLAQLETAKNRPATPAWSRIDTLLQDEIRLALRGEKTVEEALDTVAEQTDELLADYAN